MSNRKADNLLLFHHIINAGSLSKAAKTSDISISQVSKRMTQLENHLGIKLLQRSTRKLSLTSAGQSLYEKLKPITTQIEHAWQSMLDYGHAPRGKLRIAANHYYGATQLVKQIQTFNQHYPDIQIALELVNSDIDSTKQQADIYCYSHILAKNQLLPDCSLAAKKIASEKLCYVASHCYFENHPIPQHPNALDQHHCLSIHSCEKKPWIFYKGEEIFQQSIQKSFITNSFEALLQAALANMGIVQLPEKLLAQHADKPLIPVLKDYESDELQTYAYYQPQPLACKKVHLFLQTLNHNPSGDDTAQWPQDALPTEGLVPQTP